MFHINFTRNNILFEQSKDVWGWSCLDFKLCTRIRLSTAQEPPKKVLLKKSQQPKTQDLISSNILSNDFFIPGFFQIHCFVTLIHSQYKKPL